MKKIFVRSAQHPSEIVLTIFLIASISFLFSGCIEVEMLLKVKPGGSGLIEEKVLLSSEMIEMMSSFMAMGEENEENTFSIYNEDELRTEASKFGQGVEFVSGEKLLDNGREGFKAIYKFSDINQLRLDEDAASSMPANMGMENSEDSKNYVTFVFTEGHPSSLFINLPRGKEDETEEYESEFELETGEVDTEWDEAKELLKDFRFSIKVEPLGEIESSDATHLNGNIITLLEMDFEKIMEIPEKFEELKSRKLKNIEEAQDLLKDIPGFKFELKEKVQVIFK